MHFEKLPNFVIMYLLKFCELIDIKNISFCSKKFYWILSSEKFWQMKCEQKNISSLVCNSWKQSFRKFYCYPVNRCFFCKEDFLDRKGTSVCDNCEVKKRNVQTIRRPFIYIFWKGKMGEKKKKRFLWIN